MTRASDLLYPYPPSFISAGEMFNFPHPFDDATFTWRVSCRKGQKWRPPWGKRSARWIHFQWKGRVLTPWVARCWWKRIGVKKGLKMCISNPQRPQSLLDKTSCTFGTLWDGFLCFLSEAHWGRWRQTGPVASVLWSTLSGVQGLNHLTWSHTLSPHTLSFAGHRSSFYKSTAATANWESDQSVFIVASTLQLTSSS